MFNIWLLVRCFCFNRWPNEVALSKNVVTVQLPDVFCLGFFFLFKKNLPVLHSIKSEIRAPSSATFFPCSVLSAKGKAAPRSSCSWLKVLWKLLQMFQKGRSSWCSEVETMIYETALFLLYPSPTWALFEFRFIMLVTSLLYRIWVFFPQSWDCAMQIISLEH